MIGIRILLVRVRRVSCMAGVDAGEHGVVRGINMAIRATGTIMRNPEIGVIEHRAKPCLGHPRGVAGRARRRIRSRHVIRNVTPVGLRICVIRLMAAVTIRCRIAGGVVAAEVAVGASIDHGPDCAGHSRARRQHVRPLQGKACGAVVKFSVRPKKRVVAR